MNDNFEKDFKALMRKYGFSNVLCVVNNPNGDTGSIVCGDECDLASVFNDAAKTDESVKELLHHAATHKIREALESLQFKMDLNSGKVAQS